MFDLTIWLFLIFVAVMAQRNRSDRYVELSRDKFWALTRSREKPIVLLTTKGGLLKKIVYVFPYQGVLFFTDGRGTETPDGVTLIGTGESFSIS